MFFAWLYKFEETWNLLLMKKRHIKPLDVFSCTNASINKKYPIYAVKLLVKAVLSL
jgi:hypothetical protein